MKCVQHFVGDFIIWGAKRTIGDKYAGEKVSGNLFLLAGWLIHSFIWNS